MGNDNQFSTTSLYFFGGIPNSWRVFIVQQDDNHQSGALLLAARYTGSINAKQPCSRTAAFCVQVSQLLSSWSVNWFL
jgi:hypothetical protein